MLAAARLPGCNLYRPAHQARHLKQQRAPAPPLIFSAPSLLRSGPPPHSDGQISPFPWRGSHTLNLPAQIDVTNSCDASAENCEVIVSFVLPGESDRHTTDCTSSRCVPGCTSAVWLFGFCHPEFAKRNGKRLFFSYFGPRQLRDHIQRPN